MIPKEDKMTKSTKVVRQLKEEVNKVLDFAKAEKLQKTIEWCKQALYMLDTYEGTIYESEVITDVKRVLNQINL